MEKEIEKAIRETLVISNPQSINIAVKKILLLFSVSGCKPMVGDELKALHKAHNKQKGMSSDDIL